MLFLYLLKWAPIVTVCKFDAKKKIENIYIFYIFHKFNVFWIHSLNWRDTTDQLSLYTFIGYLRRWFHSIQSLVEQCTLRTLHCMVRFVFLNKCLHECTVWNSFYDWRYNFIICFHSAINCISCHNISKDANWYHLRQPNSICTHSFHVISRGGGSFKVEREKTS